jgi:hypothetical protein
MPKIKFENGVVVNVEGNPTQADIDEIAQNIGIGTDRTQGVFGGQGALAKGFSNIKESIKRSGEDLDKTLNTQGVSTPVKTIKASSGIAKGILEPLFEAAVMTPARVGGELIEKGTGYDINEAIAQNTQKLVEKGLNTQTAQKVMEGYQKLEEKDPESAMALRSLLDIGEVASYGGGGAVGKKTLQSTARGIKTGAETVAGGVKRATTPFTEKVAQLGGKGVSRAEEGLGKTKELFGKTEVLPEEAKKAFKENLLEQIEGKKTSIKKLDKTRSDIIDTIASDPRYHPEIDVENKTFNVAKATQNLQSDIQNYSRQLGDLFSKVDEAYGGYSVKDIAQKIKDKVLTEKNRSKLTLLGGQEGSFVKQTAKLLEDISKSYGDAVPRQELWKLRQGIDKAINSISDTQLAKSLRQDVRKAFAEALETSIPGDQKEMVKRAMGEMQKIIEANSYMDDVLKGFKIQGGRLTDIIRDQTATQTGALTGGLAGGIFGGPVGALGGFVASKKIGEFLAKNTLLNASQRKAIQNLVRETPEVFDDIKEYLKQFGKKGGLKDQMEGLKKRINGEVKGLNNLFEKKELPSPKTKPDNIVKSKGKEFRYHVTSEKSLDKIKKEGLKPSRGQYGKGVYFAPNEKQTGGYGNLEEIMVRIDKKKLPKDYDEFPEQGWTENNVPAKYLEYKKVGEGNDKWKPLKNDNNKTQSNIKDEISKAKAEGKSFEEFVSSGEPGKIQTTSVLDLLETKIKKPNLEQIRFARETVDDLKQDINTKESAVKMVKDLGYDEYAEYLGFLADNNTSFKMGEQTKSQLKKLWDKTKNKKNMEK